MLAFRVLMYGSGIISAVIYLANLRQVRTLREEAAEDVDESIDETIIEPHLPPKEVDPDLPPKEATG